MLIGVTIAAGVLPDADHLIDYYNWYVRRAPDRLLLLLHGWEYLAAAIVIYIFIVTEPWMLAILLGYATQIAGDQLFNRPKWFTYFLIARAVNGFRWEGIIERRAADHAYESLLASVPIFRAPIRTWFEARCATPSETDQSRGRSAPRPRS
jgi:hypothetical protein